MGSLKQLHLPSTGITSGGAIKIAQSLRDLTHLDLSDNRINDSGVKAIADHLKSLTTPILNGNQISSTGAVSIAEGLPNLIALKLANTHIVTLRNGVGKPITEKLCHSAPKNLEGVMAIATNLLNLKILDLSKTWVDLEG